MILVAQGPEEKATLLEFLCNKIGERPHDLVGDQPFQIIGSVRGNMILGAVCFMNYRRQSIEFHLCGSPGWLTRDEIGYLFAYPFVQLKCLRLWCMIRRNNRSARQGAERLGFKVLGVADDEFGEGKDGIIYSMTRDNCKWLKRRTNGHG